MQKVMNITLSKICTKGIEYTLDISDEGLG